MGRVPNWLNSERAGHLAQRLASEGCYMVVITMGWHGRKAEVLSLSQRCYSLAQGTVSAVIYLPLRLPFLIDLRGFLPLLLKESFCLRATSGELEAICSF